MAGEPRRRSRGPAVFFECFGSWISPQRSWPAFRSTRVDFLEAQSERAFPDGHGKCRRAVVRRDRRRPSPSPLVSEALCATPTPISWSPKSPRQDPAEPPRASSREVGPETCRRASDALRRALFADSWRRPGHGRRAEGKSCNESGPRPGRRKLLNASEALRHSSEAFSAASEALGHASEAFSDASMALHSSADGCCRRTRRRGRRAGPVAFPPPRRSRVSAGDDRASAARRRRSGQPSRSRAPRSALSDPSCSFRGGS